MGSTGPGKTTLLDVLAGRKFIGTVHGEVQADGRRRDGFFQRKISYVKQDDIHLATGTVREALEFSALLRQPRDLPRSENLAYVETVLQMLAMEPNYDSQRSKRERENGKSKKHVFTQTFLSRHSLSASLGDLACFIFLHLSATGRSLDKEGPETLSSIQCGSQSY